MSNLHQICISTFDDEADRLSIELPLVEPCSYLKPTISTNKNDRLPKDITKAINAWQLDNMAECYSDDVINDIKSALKMLYQNPDAFNIQRGTVESTGIENAISQYGLRKRKTYSFSSSASETDDIEQSQLSAGESSIATTDPCTEESIMSAAVFAAISEKGLYVPERI